MTLKEERPSIQGRDATQDINHRTRAAGWGPRPTVGLSLKKQDKEVDRRGKVVTSNLDITILRDLWVCQMECLSGSGKCASGTPNYSAKVRDGLSLPEVLGQNGSGESQVSALRDPSTCFTGTRAETDRKH